MFRSLPTAALFLALLAPQAPPLNVVILLCDDLGYGDLGCFGHPTIQTPNLDRLASQGMTLTNCYAACPVCSPSRAGLLTGRHPYRYGVKDFISANSGVRLPTSEISLATRLGQAGYRTALFGKWHLNSKMDGTEPTPRDHGFDAWLATQNNAAPSHKDPANFFRNGATAGTLTGYSCQILADEAIAWLGSLPDFSRPFFLNLWFHEPHEPIASPPDMTALYPGVTPPEKAVYYANVSNMDRAVGRLLDELDRRGLTSNTVVLFTSDNGPETLNRYSGASRSYGSAAPLRGRKLHVYEGGYRVPGLLRWPGRTQPGQVCDETVTALDFFPTLCDALGLPLPSGRAYDGTSFLPVFSRLPLARPAPPYWQYDASISTPWTKTLRQGRWKLLANAAVDQFELYDLVADPGETRNLAAMEATRVQYMAGLLRARQDEINNNRGPSSNQSPTVVLSSPVNGSSFPAGSDIPLTANPSDVDGSVVEVEYFRDGIPLGSTQAAPHTLTWSGSSTGGHVLSARAYDNSGASGLSAPVDVSVGATGGAGGGSGGSGGGGGCGLSGLEVLVLWILRIRRR